MKKQLVLELKVECLDGFGGRVSKIIIDPDSHQPTYLVVKRGRTYIREILVPISLVDEVTEGRVFLNITREALTALPDYESTMQIGEYQKPLITGYARSRYVRLAASNSGFMVLRERNVPERSVALEKGLPILDSERHEAGKVEGIILDSKKQQGKYVIVQQRHEPYPRLIPSDLVGDVADKSVRLRIDRDYIKRLPEYTE